MEKALRYQRNMSSWFITPMEKAWFYERLFKKMQHKRYNANQVSFMHYMKSTRLMLPVVFEEFEVPYIFSSFILFIIIVNLHKVNFSNNLGGLQPSSNPPPPSRPLRAWMRLKKIYCNWGIFFVFKSKHKYTNVQIVI